MTSGCTDSISAAAASSRLQCEFYMEKKRRRCGMTRSASSVYCVHHTPKAQETQNGNDRKVRVPCPLDPNHTIWKYDLKKHILKCNMNKMNHIHDNKPYYSKDCNLGGDFDSDVVVNETDIWEIVPFLRKINEQFDRIPTVEKANEYMTSKRLQELPSEKKHAIQQSSLIQHMLDEGIIDQKTHNFIEFGCGRAELSRYVHQVIMRTFPKEAKGGHFILIDRGSNRMKFDTKLKKDAVELSHVEPQVDRIRIDIKDVKIKPLLHKESCYVVISKHLCGVATDLTLRSISKLLDGTSALKGMCIAMCCRHVCNHRDYVNKEYVSQIIADYNIPFEYPRFFQCLTKIASWATSGSRTTTHTNTHSASMTPQERAELGLLARRIIDQGRVQYVQRTYNNLHFSAKLVNYVDPSVSLENTALILTTMEN